ncbi:cellulose biosynthesis protein BcsO [Gallaecimonas mangrovi]|uniref:cellulose biosynthesis protein BcsO n=1 Tax=Gallaecimonas mangrovi TaxID=2291597 RepID=UPI000E204299|nr:cellulose biosynthesis protein BcsO [Gallaecimonas mangrovi]
MESYDDINRFKEKTAQSQLDYQTFSNKDVQFSSSWPLLNQLAEQRSSAAPAQHYQAAKTMTLPEPAAPKAVVQAEQPAPAKDPVKATPSAPPQQEPAETEQPQSTALRSLLKKVSL